MHKTIDAEVDVLLNRITVTSHRCSIIAMQVYVRSPGYTFQRIFLLNYLLPAIKDGFIAAERRAAPTRPLNMLSVSNTLSNLSTRSFKTKSFRALPQVEASGRGNLASFPSPPLMSAAPQDTNMMTHS